MKRILLFVLGCMMYGMMSAQHQQIFDEYCREAGDHAEIFLGKVESSYPSALYTNHPYWLFGDFVSGDVVYKGLLYRNVQMRYDAYLKQLVVNTPVKHSNVYVAMDLVDKFSLSGVEFERRDKEFVAILYKSSRMELIEQMNVALREEVIGLDKSKYKFLYKLNYYVLRDGLVYEVSNLKSILKLYPDKKKELKNYAKAHSLDFKVHRRNSLISVIKYVDELMMKP